MSAEQKRRELFLARKFGDIDTFTTALDVYIQAVIHELELDKFVRYTLDDMSYTHIGYNDLDDDDKDEIDYAATNTDCLRTVDIIANFVDDTCPCFQVLINGVELSMWWTTTEMYMMFATWQHLKSSRETIIQELRRMIRDHDDGYGEPRPYNPNNVE